MKQYENILMNILFFQEEDVIRTSLSIEDEKDNVGEMPEFPFMPGI
jgi:hypothetical protein